VVSTALVKDVYDGKKRESVLSVVMSMIVIAPVVSPVLGAFLLQYVSWRGLFWVLAVIGIISLAVSLLLSETITSRYTGTVIQSLRRLGTVLKNPGFASLLFIFSLTMLTMLAFVGVSSYIYEDFFGLSGQMFSFYFALNALGMIAGPILYLRLSRSFSRTPVITACFVIMIASGALVCLFGNIAPLVFALLLFPASVMGCSVRSPGTYLMLEQQKEDTGSASALINCVGLVFGAAGIFLASQNTGNLIFVLGALNVVTGLVCLTGWLLVGKLNLVKEVA